MPLQTTNIIQEWFKENNNPIEHLQAVLNAIILNNGTVSCPVSDTASSNREQVNVKSILQCDGKNDVERFRDK